jgi:glycosyltransferase involved in cell wall biosynthesis
MSQLGHHTEVVCLDDPKAEYIQSFPFTVHPQGKLTRKYGYTPKISRWIVENSHRFDVAIIEGLWNHASVGGWMGLRRSGLPYVVFTHGMLDPWFKKTYPVKHLLKQIFWVLWQGKVLRDSHCVLFTCEEERRAARGAFWGFAYAGSVVAFGTNDVPQYKPDLVTKFRETVPGLGSRPYLLFLSRIHRKKGCDLLIDAFNKLSTEFSEFDLVVAGPDSEDLAAKLIEASNASGNGHRVHWPGMLQGFAKWGAFYGADAFVLPSHQENFGIVVAEAMACGTPVLITDKVNIWREVEAAGAGRVGADTQEGVEHMLRNWLLTSAVEKTAMRPLAREGFLKRFHIDAATADLLRVLALAAGVRT